MGEVGESGCIFCKIVAGKIPCYKLYEDDDVFSFLDIGPLSRGHALLIPKRHYVTLHQMPPELVGRCMSVVPRLSKAIVAATGVSGWNLLQNNGEVAGQEVGHVHFHIIPRAAGDGLGYRWNAGDLSADEAGRLVEQVAEHLHAR